MGSKRAFHEMDCQCRDGDGSSRCIDLSGYGGKTCKDAKSKNVRRLRAAERPLHFGLRSNQLVHDEYLRERPIDPGTVVALLSAKRLMPRCALLRNRAPRFTFNARSGRSS